MDVLVYPESNRDARKGTSALAARNPDTRRQQREAVAAGRRAIPPMRAVQP